MQKSNIKMENDKSKFKNKLKEYKDSKKVFLFGEVGINFTFLYVILLFDF